MRTKRFWLISTAFIIAVVAYWFRIDHRVLWLFAKQESAFGYSVHQAPRVFAYHLPIHASPLTQPDPGLHVFVEPDLGSELTVAEVRVAFRRTEGAEEVEKVCAPVPDEPVPRWRCAFEPAQGLNRPSYRARVRASEGGWFETARSYQTQTGTPSGNPTVFPLRVPLPRPGFEIDEASRLDVLLVWDSAANSGSPEFFYHSRDFFRDVQRAIYDDVLSDPVYRWRDSQIAFWTYSRTGMTRGYYSPRNTRCGQNPWLDTWSADLEFVDVVGVIHLRSEPRAPPGTDSARDCAGRAVPRPNVGTFSARGDRPLVLKHELSHAAFGLGDEYDETDATARVPGESLPSQRPDCCCLIPSDDTTGPPVGSTGQTTDSTTRTGLAFESGERVRCVSEDGTTERSLLPNEPANGLLPCAELELGEDCSVSGNLAGFCPAKSVNCVLASAFLGGEVPQAAARPNRFFSPEECEPARAAALAHPGVEKAADGLGECRQICGATQPCACAPGAEAWHVDLDPEAGSPTNDLMKEVSATESFLGSTCAWCVETSLCVRWQRALGESSEASWAHCANPAQ